LETEERSPNPTAWLGRFFALNQFLLPLNLASVFGHVVLAYHYRGWFSKGMDGMVLDYYIRRASVRLYDLLHPAWATSDVMPGQNSWTLAFIWLPNGMALTFILSALAVAAFFALFFHRTEMLRGRGFARFALLSALFAMPIAFLYRKLVIGSFHFDFNQRADSFVLTTLLSVSAVNLLMVFLAFIRSRKQPLPMSLLLVLMAGHYAVWTFLMQDEFLP
jgi:hypothetical protein